MRSAASLLAPPLFATEAFTDATSAVTRLDEIYERNTRFLRDRFEAYVNGEPLTTRVRATYPFVRITTSSHARLDSRLSYGFRRRSGRTRDHCNATWPVPCLSHRTDQALNRKPRRASRNRRV